MLAAAIDLAVVWTAVTTVAVPAASSYLLRCFTPACYDLTGAARQLGAVSVIVVVVVVVLPLAYVIGGWWQGGTAGMRALRLSVRRVDGGHPGFGRCAARAAVLYVALVVTTVIAMVAVFRLHVPFYAGVFASVAVLIPGSRGLHDVLAGTHVVRDEVLAEQVYGPLSRR